MQQILRNNRVAFALKNIQIEGVATVKRQTLLEETFLTLYKKKYGTAYNEFLEMNASRVVEVEVVQITEWSYDGNEVKKIALDMKEGELKVLKFP